MTIIPTPIGDVLDAREQSYRDYYDQYAADQASAHAQAALIAEYRLRAPGLPAGSYLSMAQAGYDPKLLDGVSQQYVPQPDTNTVKQAAGAVQKPPPKPKSSGGGLWDSITGVVGDVAGAASWVGDELSPQHVARFATDEVVKPVVRFGTAGLESLTQAGMNVLEHGAPHHALIPGIPDTPGSPGNDNNLADVAKGTTLGQMIAHHDYGSGYLAPNAERANAAALQRQVRGTVGDYSTGGPQAATIGRVFAGAFFDPHSQPYNIASGAVDAYVSAKYDPANVLGKAWHAAAVTHNTFAAADELADAGAYSGVRKYLNPQRFSDWIDSTKGRVFSGAVADEGSAAAIDAMTKRKLPTQVIADLAAASTPDEVAAVMKDAVSNGLRNVPKTSALFGPGGTGYAISHALGTRDWRILNMTPGYGFDINDNRAAVNYIDRAAANGLVKGPAREALVNGMIDAVNTPDPAIRGPRIYRMMNELGSQLRQSIAGRDYLQTAEGSRFLSDLHGAARSGTPADVEAMLAERFPAAKITDDLVSNVMHAANTTTSVEQRAQDALGVLGRDKPDLSWLDRRAAQLPSDIEGDLPRYRDQATPLADLVRGRPTRSDVRAWLTTAFPDETFDDSTVADMARAASGGAPGERLADTLTPAIPMGRAHQSPQVAQMLGRWSASQTLEARQGFIDAGAPDSIPSISLGGKVYPIQGMHLPDEALNGFVPGPNADDIRRNTSMFNNLLDAHPDNGRPYLSLLARSDGQQRLALDLLDRASGVWRRLAVTRPALTLRVLGGQQIAMAMDGQDSIFSHPINHIAHVLASDKAVDLNDSAFLDATDAARAQWRRALGADPAGNFGLDKVALGRVSRVTPELKDFVPAWGNEINQLAASPLARATTDALLSPTIEREGTQINALDELKDRFWNGDLARYRDGLLAGSDPYDDTHWTNILRHREGADRYIDTVVDRVMQKTTGDDELMRAISTGKIGDAPLGDGRQISGALRSKLADLHGDGIYPSLVKGKVAYGADQKGMLDRAQRWFWQHMVEVPSSKITKQPLGAQLYAQEVARHAGPDFDWRTVLDAMEHGDTTAIKAAIADGPSHLTASEVDALARTHVLDSLDRYIYNGHQRAQFTDIFHTLIPFGEIFRQEMKRWATLTADNLPTVLRRGSQVVQNSRDEGWFFPNPTTGQESVHIPLPGIVQSVIAGAIPGAQTDPGMGLSAPVAGFNIVGQGLPGFGAVAAIPADAVLKHMPGGNAIRGLLEPYGPPDTSGGVKGLAESLAPSWLKKIVSGFDEDPAKDRMFNSTLVSTLIAKQTAHPEDYPNTPQGQAKLLSDATEAARGVLVIRGIAQALLPSAPALDQKIKVDDHWVELSAIVKDWTQIEHDTLSNGGQMSDAVAEFIGRYGNNAALAMVPQSVPKVYGLSASQGMVDWKKANGDFAKAFPNVWPLFAPGPGAGSTDPSQPGNKSDYLNYLFQLGDGSRKLLDAPTRLELRDYRVGSMLYDRARSEVGVSPDTGQRAWLASVREKIGELYPGYAKNDGQYPPGALGKAASDVAIRELAKAASDPTVAQTPVAQAIRLYDKARNEAVDALDARHNRTPFAAASAAPDRAWLRQIATYLTEHYVGFGTVFDYVYSHEVQDRSTDNVLSAQDAATLQDALSTASP